MRDGFLKSAIEHFIEVQPKPPNWNGKVVMGVFSFGDTWNDQLRISDIKVVDSTYLDAYLVLWMQYKQRSDQMLNRMPPRAIYEKDDVIILIFDLMDSLIVDRAELKKWKSQRKKFAGKPIVESYYAWVFSIRDDELIMNKNYPTDPYSNLLDGLDF